jgi:signal peptidase I
MIVAWYGAACLVTVAAFMAAISWVRRHLLIVTVTGWSMAPALIDGDRVLVRRHRGEPVRRGDVLVISRPVVERRYVKRVVAVAGDPMPSQVATTLPAKTPVVPPGCLVVFGDNPASEDSRHWGPISAEYVVGVVLGLPKQAHSA